MEWETKFLSSFSGSRMLDTDIALGAEGNYLGHGSSSCSWR